MRYSYFRDLVSQTWMIEPLTAGAYLPAYKGLFLGMRMEPDKEDVCSRVIVESKSRDKSKRSKYVNVVRLEGVMTREDGDCHEGTRTIASYLTNADMDDDVIGHVIKINSGGGASNSVPDLADAIRSLTKPCVAFVDGMMASAAMYAGSYCTYIYANREQDRVGCIGTLIEIMDYPKKAELPDGEVYLRIYADASTEKNLEYEEALKGNTKEIVDNLLNPVNEKFINDVKANRPSISDEQTKGRTYFAKDALGSLIDEIGSLDAAINKVVELSGNNNLENNNTNQMINAEHLQAIPSCADLESVDGTVTLTADQVSDVDAALAKVDDVASLNRQLADANSKIVKLDETIRQKDAKIKELQDAIDNHGADPAREQYHNGDHLNEDTDEEEIDPLTYCLNFIEKHPR